MTTPAKTFRWEVLSEDVPIQPLVRQLNRRLGELARFLGSTLPYIARVVDPSEPAWTTSTWGKILALRNGGAIEFGSTNGPGVISWLMGSTDGLIGRPLWYLAYAPARDNTGDAVYALKVDQDVFGVMGALQRDGGTVGPLANTAASTVLTHAALVAGAYLVTVSEVGVPANKAIGLYVVGGGTGSVTPLATSGGLTLATAAGDLQVANNTGASGSFAWAYVRLV